MTKRIRPPAPEEVLRELILSIVVKAGIIETDNVRIELAKALEKRGYYYDISHEVWEGLQIIGVRGMLLVRREIGAIMIESPGGKQYHYYVNPTFEMTTYIGSTIMKTKFSPQLEARKVAG